MRIKVIIEEGRADIVMTPETEFEKTLIKDAHGGRLVFDSCEASIEEDYHFHSSRRGNGKEMILKLRSPQENNQP